MAYTFEQVFAADPANPSNIAQNASITIFAPGDGTMTPIAITDPDGQALANPIPVNANGFGSAFMADIDRVAWLGGGFTGFFTSYEGMKEVAVAAQAAAETAGADAAAAASAGVAGVAANADAAAASAAASATAAANSAALVGAPADSAIAAAINGTGATKTALNATIVAPRGANFTDSPFPVFTKQPAAIFTSASTTYSTIYHPTVLRVDNILGSPLGKFYMWYSTDHKGIDGKIGLAYANSPEGPWTNYGTVWVDTTVGQETETPSVVWNPKENLFFMSYQMDWNGNPAGAGAVGAQSTLLATSPDGITWTRVGIIIDIAASADVPGNGHTGYARLHRLGSTWVALHLLGGGDYSHRGISYSRNGRNWTLDTRPVEPQTHFAADSASKTILYELFQWRGETWGLGTEGTIGSGVDPVVRDLVFGRVTPDFRHFAEVPERLFELNAAWETKNVRSVHVFTDKGKVYVIYQTDNNFGLAVAGA